MKTDLYKQNGQKATTKVELSDAVFGVEVNKKLLSQYVHVYRSNQREAIAHTKDRSEVSGGGRKPHRQKGTGKARAGSNRSPIWTGGGVTFGPTKERNWKKAIPAKMRKGALRSALSQLTKESKLKIVDNIEIKDKELTKQAQSILKAFGDPKKVTLVTAETEEKLLRAFGNLSQVRVMRVGELNAYSVLTAGEILMLKDAVDFTEKWAK